MSDYIGQVIEILRRGHEPNPLTVNNAAAELAQLRAALEEAKAVIEPFCEPSTILDYLHWEESEKIDTMEDIRVAYLRSAEKWLQKYGGQK